MVGYGLYAQTEEDVVNVTIVEAKGTLMQNSKLHEPRLVQLYLKEV